MFSSALFLLAALPSALAHGFVSRVSVSSGASTNGPAPGGRSDGSAIRVISENSPVKGAYNPALNCGINAQIASQVLDAQPGDSVSFNWAAGGGQKWPHNTGPMLTYMASCGDTPCNQFNSANAKWFKIHQVGRKDNGEWAQVDLFNSQPTSVTIPSILAAGNYLIRHEIIALHLGQSQGGAEFYPSCTQLRVGGSQTGRPSDDELVSLPGAYSDTDPGILVPNVYDTNAKYVFPGPKVTKLAGAAAPGPVSPPASEPSPPASEPSPPSTCTLKKKKSTTKRAAIKRHAMKRLSKQ